jgi:hypothetical protein
MTSTVRTTDSAFVEATLTYDNDDLRRAVTHTVECGVPIHVVHESNCYVGDVDVDPYLETSPLALLNSRVASEGDTVLPSSTRSLPIADQGGIGEWVELESAVSVPEVAFTEIAPEAATLSAGDRELTVDPGDEVIVELDPQTVEVQVPSDARLDVEFSKPFDAEVISVGSQEPVSARVTKLESVTVTPRVRVTHHGVGSVYGVDDGVALPRDERNPMARRAMSVSEVDTEVVQPQGVDEDVVVVRRGDR